MHQECVRVSQQNEYLAGAITLTTSRGRSISFNGSNRSEYGSAFRYDAPARCQIVACTFSRGQCTGIETRELPEREAQERQRLQAACGPRRSEVARVCGGAGR